MDQSPDKSHVYSKKYLKCRLIERYGDKIYFTSEDRRAEVLCFKDATANIIREYQNDKDVDKKRKILETAVKLIQNDISLVNVNSMLYFSVNSMEDQKSQLNISRKFENYFMNPYKN